jgi:hypothetical protein
MYLLCFGLPWSSRNPVAAACIRPVSSQSELSFPNRTLLHNTESRVTKVQLAPCFLSLASFLQIVDHLYQHQLPIRTFGIRSGLLAERTPADDTPLQDGIGAIPYKKGKLDAKSYRRCRFILRDFEFGNGSGTS